MELINDFFREMIVKAVKAHNAPDEYLSQFNKGMKLVYIGKYEKMGKATFDTHHLRWHEDEKTFEKIEDAALRLLVKFSFKPADKYDDKNIVLYEIIIYSCGQLGIYFDGTAYKA